MEVHIHHFPCEKYFTEIFHFELKILFKYLFSIYMSNKTHVLLKLMQSMYIYYYNIHIFINIYVHTHEYKYIVTLLQIIHILYTYIDTHTYTHTYIFYVYENQIIYMLFASLSEGTIPTAKKNCNIMQLHFASL